MKPEVFRPGTEIKQRFIKWQSERERHSHWHVAILTVNPSDQSLLCGPGDTAGGKLVAPLR